MKIKWISVAVFIVLVVVVSSYFFITQLKLVSGWNTDDESTVVLVNKTWNLSFSEKIDEKTVNENTVYVTNEKGEKINAKISLSADKKTLKVSPPEKGYNLKAKFYTLHVGDEVKSVFGRGMSSDQTIQFVVQESLPIIGSKDKLDQYFASIMEAEEEGQSKFGIRVETMESSNESADSAAGAVEKQVSQDVSETNIQVQGVDETDIVKTNGSHIYQITDNKVNIIETTNGAKMKKLDPLLFSKNFTPSQLFLHEDRLLVIGYSYEEMNIKEEGSAKKMIAPATDKTKAIIYNIADPSNPKEERTLTLDGYMVSARKIGSLVYLVTNQYPQYWILRENDEIDLRPRYSDSKVSDENLVVDYDDIQYFPDSKEPNYTLISAFDLEKPDKEASVTTYLGSGDQMYMSTENLYLAVRDWGIRPLIDGPVEDRVNTTVYKFSIDGLKVEFNSSTELEGSILNQFSMDEHNGYFRVATTEGESWNGESPSSNNLLIFDENLKQVSSIEDLARGERIYSARFMGDRVYIVTFKETDPLFVIDTSEPESPKVLGELKIPGFSNYLHPYDENHLIGFGYDTKSVTTKDSKEPLILTGGVKLSLFDVSDMKNPKEKFTEIIGGRGTYSPLNYDHKALLFDKKKNLFAFPINVYQEVEGSEFDQKFEFQGAYVLSVDSEEGFKIKSRISHMKGNEPYEEWENEIQRLVYVGDTLYALSNSKITSHSLNDFQLKEELSLH
ncbi:beta-propeller domain-containing protein [Robertmurraya kyonggiensis]|nr:beta-propeller domain-containing protein [Robertmurraya kyonggiensis]